VRRRRQLLPAGTRSSNADAPPLESSPVRRNRIPSGPILMVSSEGLTLIVRFSIIGSLLRCSIRCVVVFDIFRTPLLDNNKAVWRELVAENILALGSFGVRHGVRRDPSDRPKCYFRPAVRIVAPGLAIARPNSLLNSTSRLDGRTQPVAVGRAARAGRWSLPPASGRQPKDASAVAAPVRHGRSSLHR
jgi:hypothetical protein